MLHFEQDLVNINNYFNYNFSKDPFVFGLIIGCLYIEYKKNE